jgi:LysR family transcriptional regulator, regulator for bpeEF and oprC
MDKLRAIQYLTRAVEAGSFTAAAKSLEVSTPAVAQLIRALERSIGIVLFHRTTRGLALTADGERYYETARKVTADLRDLEQSLGPRGAKPRGTLTVGMREAVGLNCVMPRITRFLARFPDIELVTKPVRIVQDIDEKKLDLAVLVGWPSERNLVVRPLAQTRFVVCASPEYWTREGRPHEPEELRHHHCLLFRGGAEILRDHWIFEKKGERRTVDVKSRLLSDGRTWLDEAACAGAGVIRLADITLSRYLSSGLLVPVLTDWESLEAPTIYAAYRRSQRSSKLVRAFLDFLVEVFAELESERSPAPATGIPRVPKPDWYDRAHGRQSAYVARGRKSSKTPRRLPAP